MSRALLATLILLSVPGVAPADKPPTRDEVKQAVLRAVNFFHKKVARGGGYLWQYSGDLTLREAEGKVPSETMLWVQPPGTPTIGEAFLDAYEATGERACLEAAQDAAAALLDGQMHTGGWAYQVERDPTKRKEYGYRDLPEGKVTRWKKATVLDDDTTQSALRFLMRLDRTLGFKDARLHEAVTYALKSILAAQYPNGAWFGWWERKPSPVSEKDFPIRKASFPEKWSRTAERTPARYILNDNVVPDVIRTLLQAAAIYRNEDHRKAALRGGDFLILAQLPEPQPAWAQHYDLNMQPCWGRKFEPPAITGLESQTVLETLLLLYRQTSEKKYLEPIAPALAYLKKSQLEGGKLARFYEMKTNKPLYFNRKYELTYSADDLPTHYGFIVPSRLNAIEAAYQQLLKTPRPAERRVSARDLEKKVRTLVDSQDRRGAWVEKGRLRFHKIEPESGVINCQTFARNVTTLCQYLQATKDK